MTDQLKTVESAFRIRPDLLSDLHTVHILKQGFILTSLLWASLLAMAIDRRMNQAAIFAAIAGVFTLFGLIHSPLSNNALFLPVAVPGLGRVMGAAKRDDIVHATAGVWLFCDERIAVLIFGARFISCQPDTNERQTATDR